MQVKNMNWTQQNNNMLDLENLDKNTIENNEKEYPTKQRNDETTMVHL